MFYKGISPPKKKKKLSFTNGPTKENRPKFLQKVPNTNKTKFYKGISPPKTKLSWAHQKNEGKKKKGNDSTQIKLSFTKGLAHQKKSSVGPTKKMKEKRKKETTPLGIEPRISGSVDQRLIHWATESFC